MTRVCVALPVKNGARYLTLAIDSVLAQEGVDFELRIIDNGSQDDSVSIARGYEQDSRVSVVVNEHDLGIYGSLNRVLSTTDCEYYVPFACDDLMLAGNLSAKVQALESTGAALVHSSALHMNEMGGMEGMVRDHRVTAPICPPPWFLPELIPHNRVVLPSVMLRRSALLSIGGFDGRNHYAADWQAWMQLSLRETVVTLSAPLVAYRAHPASGTSEAVATGKRGMYDTGSIAQVLADPAYPPEWDSWRDDLITSVYSCAGLGIHREGARRLTNGWSGYWILARGLARAPGDQELLRSFGLALCESGLALVKLPWDAVALLPETDEEVTELLAVAQTMGPLLGRMLVLVHPSRRDEALARLAPRCADAPYDIVIVECQEPVSELRPGRIAVGGWRGEWIREAEELSIPAWPMSAPDVFAKAPRVDHWQTLASVDSPATGS